MADYFYIHYLFTLTYFYNYFNKLAASLSKPKPFTYENTFPAYQRTLLSVFVRTR